MEFTAQQNAFIIRELDIETAIENEIREENLAIEAYESQKWFYAILQKDYDDRGLSRAIDTAVDLSRSISKRDLTKHIHEQEALYRAINKVDKSGALYSYFLAIV